MTTKKPTVKTENQQKTDMNEIELDQAAPSLLETDKQEIEQILRNRQNGAELANEIAEPGEEARVAYSAAEVKRAEATRKETDKRVEKLNKAEQDYEKKEHGSTVDEQVKKTLKDGPPETAAPSTKEQRK